MDTQNREPEAPVRRLDRVLTFSALGLVALSIACFIATIIGSVAGMSQDDFGSGIWPVLGTFPLIALPLALVVILVLVLTSSVRKGRADTRP